MPETTERPLYFTGGTPYGTEKRTLFTQSPRSQEQSVCLQQDNAWNLLAWGGSCRGPSLRLYWNMEA